jgi:hypothetical protein
VYLFPAKVEVSPAFLHVAPAFTAAFELIGEIRERIKIRNKRFFFIPKVLGVLQDIATV